MSEVLKDPAVESGNGIQVLTKAALILRLLADSSGGLSFSELVAQAGLPRTTVHRIRHALEHEGFVAVDGNTGRLRLGPALLRLAVASRRDLRAVVAPHMARLSAELNETVDLGVLDGMHVLFIAQHAAPARELMAVSRVGARLPAYCTANGKVLLAQLPPDELLSRLPKRLDGPGAHTPVSREHLLRELVEIRETGLAYDRGEHRPGICSAGVAVKDVDGSVAAISVPMPAARFEENETDVVVALMRTREEVQEALLGA